MHHFYWRLASILLIEKHFFNKTRFQKTLYGFAAWKHCWQDQDPWVSHLHMVMSHWNKVKQQVLILNSADLFISSLICISWLSVVKRPKNIGKNGKRNNFSVFDFKFRTQHTAILDQLVTARWSNEMFSLSKTLDCVYFPKVSQQKLASLLHFWNKWPLFMDWSMKFLIK